jgi:1-acyl-sn-glycerol-3-phosphate acyltransferase
VLRAPLIIVLLGLNLLFWGSLIFVGAVFKLITFGSLRRMISRRLLLFAEFWVDINDAMFDRLLATRWEATGLEGLNRDEHYLVIANHVSWIDIFALFRVFQRKTPFLRFFIKQQLLWFPFAGQAAWALGFPFMRRYTPEYLSRHPEKKGRDLETTRRMCSRYRNVPVSILNFLEGTRFTRAKHEQQGAPYRNLLRPRTGGISFVLASLGEQIESILDVTLVYPSLDVTMWDFVTNRVPWVRVDVRRLAVPAEFCDAAITEPGPQRERFKAWIDGIWREKDETIESLMLV